MLKKRKIKDDFFENHLDNDKKVLRILDEIFPIDSKYRCAQTDEMHVRKGKLNLYRISDKPDITDGFGGYVCFRGKLARRV